MKRSGPIPRRAPLRAKSPSPKMKTQARRPKKKRQNTPASLRAAVIARAAGHCDYCGLAFTGGVDVHHRKLRSRGGEHTVENCVALHPACHAEFHRLPKWATRLGFMVPAWDDPAETPIWHHCRSWQQPGDAFTPANPITEGAKQ